MANKPRPPTVSTVQPPSNDGDGNHIHNKILLSPPKNRRCCSRNWNLCA